MINKTLLIVSLLITNVFFGQDLNEIEIMGKWKTINVKIPDQIPQKDAVKFIKDAFTGSIFNFKGNRTFSLEYGKKADERINELFKINGENWVISKNQIMIGTDANRFSSMHITIQRMNGNTYFLLPMMQLKMEKISTDKPKPIVKSNIRKPELQTKKNTISLKNIELDKKEIISFSTIETPPLAPDCKSKWDVEKQKKCTAMFIQKHIARKFNVDLAQNIGLSGKIRIECEFVIDKNGEIINISAHGGPEAMNKHSIEVISTLPKISPGKINGKIVNVLYKLPITFVVQD